MPPIRVGLVGLSGRSPSTYEGVSWTSSAHLPYLLSSPHYSIVALLNTSVESARAAIARYSLPASTRAYGDPEDLARDDEVDLVVCSVRVDQHFEPVRPSIRAGKSIFVEWPLERNLYVAREMATLAVKYNSKTIVGLQGSFSPVIRKMKELLKKERIGNVLSSTVFVVAGNGGKTEVKNVRYFLERDVGGNLVSIHFGHSIEFITSVLGEFDSWNGLMSNRHESKDIIDPAAENKVIVKNASNTVPDQILFHGFTGPTKVPISIHYRGGPPFPGTPRLEWRIQGDNGEIRVTSSSASLQVGRPDTKLELYEEGKEEVEVLEVGKDEWDELPIPAQNIARMYEAFRKQEWVPDFEWAVKRHEFLEEMWRKYDESLVQ